MFDGQVWLYLIPLMVVLFAAFALTGGEKKTASRGKKAAPKAPPPIMVDGVLYVPELPEPEKKKERARSAFGIYLE